MVSPQLHMQHDELFETECPADGNLTTLSRWKKIMDSKYTGHMVYITKSEYQGQTRSL